MLYFPRGKATFSSRNYLVDDSPCMPEERHLLQHYITVHTEAL